MKEEKQVGIDKCLGKAGSELSYTDMFEDGPCGVKLSKKEKHTGAF